MSDRIKFPKALQTVLYVTALTVVSLLPSNLGYAQSTGTSARSGSLGTSGGTAQPLGAGAGGSTAAAGDTFSNGSSSGTGPVNQNRYGGGVAATDSETTDTILARPLDKSEKHFLDALVPENDWCEDYDAQKLTGKAALSGANGRRLIEAQRYLAPGLDPKGNRSELYLLSNYQQELANPRPDATLAGTYIGLASASRLDEQRLVETNRLLCVTTAPAQMKKILDAARGIYKKHE